MLFHIVFCRTSNSKVKKKLLIAAVAVLAIVVAVILVIFDVHFVIVIIAFEKQATIAQVVERNIGNVEVTGPTPVSSFYFLSVFTPP